MFKGSISLLADNFELDDHNSPTDKRSYQCPHSDCGKVFRFKSEIIRHQATHTDSRPFVCEFEGCSKSFKRADALENHFRTHTGETPFVCEFEGCGMGFTTKASLRYHTLKHKNNKIFKCNYPGCNKSFITMFQLKQHEKSVNVHKKICAHTEDDFYESSCSYDKNQADSDSGDSYMYPMYETKKLVETEFSSSPSNYQFDDQYQNKLDGNVAALQNENELLKQRLEMSEKLLYMFLQQRMPTDNSLCLNQYNQGPVMQAPETFINDQATYGFSGFAQFDEDNKLF